MRENPPSIGIDFGTTNCSMAWYNPRIGQAEIILNAEGEPKTPSLVYFAEDETLVGKPVEELLEDVSADKAQREEVFQRTIKSIKRDLLAPPVISIPGGRYIRPVDISAEILRKLKRDAEDGHFHREVTRAVITCPAAFHILQRQTIEEAGHLAGFTEVVLLEEPVAGALAYARAGLDVGAHVLVYDLGGGTFDLAVLDNEDESFSVVTEPRGIDRVGGDDFDLAFYYHCDRLARDKYGRPISQTGNIDLTFLRLCRLRKENLTLQNRRKVSSYLAWDNGSVRFEHEIDRATFERLINPYVEQTVKLTETIVKEAEDRGHEVDTVVLTGGSSRVPLVARMLKEALPVEPLKFDKMDLAVALGAAHHTSIEWPPPPPPPVEFMEYGDEVRRAWTDKRLDKEEVNRLDELADTLGLRREQAAEIEREILEDSKELVLIQQYRRAVETVWRDEKQSRLETRWLDELAYELGLDQDRTSHVEREVMGDVRDAISTQQTSDPRFPSGPEDFDSIYALIGHSTSVLSVAFSPDGQYLASGSFDGTIRGWNVHTGQSVGTLRGHSGEVRTLTFSPDGQYLASGSFDGTVKMWALPHGELLHSLDHPEWVWSVIISPDGLLLASGGSDKKIRIWEVESGRLLRTLDGHAHWILSETISPDGQLLVSGGADEAVKVWQVHTGELLHSFEHSAWVWSVAVSADGRLIADAGEDGVVKVWELQTGKQLHTIPGHSGPALSVAIDPAGKLLFSGSADNRIKVWNAETGDLLNVLSGHSREVNAIAVSPDGQLLASGGHDHVIMLWGKVGPDGKLVIGNGHDETIDLGDDVEQEDDFVSANNLDHDQPGEDQYRNVVTRVWQRAQQTKDLYGSEITRLQALMGRLGLHEHEAAHIEREVMGDNKENVLETFKRRFTSSDSSRSDPVHHDSRSRSDKPPNLPD